MRYVINDDDLEDWKALLEELNKDLENHTIEYVIGQMDMYIKEVK